MSCNSQHGYGIKCEPDSLPLLNAAELFQNSREDSSTFIQASPSETSRLPEQPPRDLSGDGGASVQDMDLNGYLDNVIDDKALTEWNSLFNGQLEGIDTLDPMTGIQNATGFHGDQIGAGSICHSGTDLWLIQETHRLERQQKVQQQKLLELQQTLIKTEILKNQLQIATISQTHPSATNSPPHNNTVHDSQAGNNIGFNFTPSVGRSRVNSALNSSSRLHLGSPKPTVPTSLSFGSSGTSCNGSELGPSNSVPKPVTLKCDTNIIIAPLPPLSPTTTVSSPSSPFPMEGDKRKVHNLIEKKYRCSINDRIGILRDKVSRNCKENKRLQKSAVLQKTIDFIEHLEKKIRRLEEENGQLRDALAKATNKPRIPSFNSPPSTPQQSLSPKSLDSEPDSMPFSTDGYLSDETSRETSPHNACVSSSRSSVTATQQGNLSILASHLLHGTNHTVPQYLMVVMLVAIFFVNPLALFGGATSLNFPSHSAGSVRTLNAYEQIGGEDGAVVMSSAMYWGLWVFRLVVAALCFGWSTLKSVPNQSDSLQTVDFWRLRKQADNDVQMGEFVSARENLERALSVIGRPVPSASYVLIPTLLWSLLSHFLFQVMFGHWAVSLASIFVSGGGNSGDKKQDLRVSFADVSKTYHLLHQLSMASNNTCHSQLVDFYLGVNALNFAEADHPFGDLSLDEFAEMYFSQGLQSQLSLPYGGGLFKWYYFFCFRITNPSKNSSPLKWALTSQGKQFLMRGQWASEVKLGSRLFQGDAALPLYSVTRAFCKTLLCDTFDSLLVLESDKPLNQTALEDCLETFKWTLRLSKDVSSYKPLPAVSQCSDSGFTVIQWWSAVGVVASYWASGDAVKAKDYYSTIEALPGDSSAVTSTLHLAFKACQTYKKGKEVPVEVILQLCNLTGKSLITSVTDLLQDNFSSTENELHRLGLLLACDWLLSLRVTLWETHGKKGDVVRDIRQGFYQDLETLSKLVTLLPTGLSQLRMYKGCYQLFAGANPMSAQALLGDTGYSRLRRRVGGKDVETMSVESISSLSSPAEPIRSNIELKQTPV